MLKEKEVIEIIKKALKTKSKLTLKTTSNDLEEWDSLGHLNILLALEKKVSSKISKINHLSNAHSIKKIIDLLKRNKLIS